MARPPEFLRSRVVGYIWDTTVPPGSVVPSPSTGTVTYVVLRSGSTSIDGWLTERRDVRQDYRRIFGEEPAAPGAIAVAADSNDTRSAADSYLGPLHFVAAGSTG